LKHHFTTDDISYRKCDSVDQSKIKSKSLVQTTDNNNSLNASDQGITITRSNDSDVTSDNFDEDGCGQTRSGPSSTQTSSAPLLASGSTASSKMPNDPILNAAFTDEGSDFYLFIIYFFSYVTTFRGSNCSHIILQ